MLSSLGIASCYTINNPSLIKFENGEYFCRQSYDLNITSGRAKFAKLIGFTQEYKTEKLKQIIGTVGRAKETYDVISDAQVSVEEVFDITVDNTPHTYWTGGLNVSNCVEISLKPVIDWKLSSEEEVKLRTWCPELAHKELSGLRLTGWQKCNLTTINGTAATTERSFYKACIHAAFIGTLQAAYTDIPYIGGITRVINEHDALLGVSICGCMDSPQVLFDENVLTIGARLVRATNRMVAGLIGINPAARCTCVKPEGTVSKLLGAASGIHPHHSSHYFARVQANKKEPVYQHFKAANPQMTELSVYDASGNTDVITFPVTAPKKAILRKSINAIQFLELVRLVQQAWVLPGADPKSRNPDINHNVSNTCTVTDKEWDEVEAFIWDHRKFFTGISMLKDTGDTAYAQAPRQEVTTDADIVRWNSLLPKPVDYTTMYEAKDVTALKEIVACAGGACDLS